MFIIKNKKIFITISVFLVLMSVLALSFIGLKVGIDFKGGSMIEVIYKEKRPDLNEVNLALINLNSGSFSVQPTGSLGYIIKTKEISEADHNLILNTLTFENEYLHEEIGFNSIGPSVGKELARKAILAIIFVSLGIILFIAFAFRKVSKPIASWKYGIVAVISLIHDVLIPVGIFTLIASRINVEIDTLFVVAILTILGLSVSDTIVIFDRIRENLREQNNLAKINFSEIVGLSLNQSYLRSIFTSLTLLFVLISLFLLGPSSTKYFALLLTLGTFFGTYSSIFLASPLLVLLAEKQNKNK